MLAIERAADAAGVTYAQMMENAGRGLAEVVQAEFGLGERPAALALVGSGNNGGDALVALDYLARAGWQVSAYLVRPRSLDDPLIQRMLKAGGRVLNGEKDPKHAALAEALPAHDVLLDGVLGTGTRLPLREGVAQTLDFVRRALAEMPARPTVVAVDCPSGVDCQSGDAAPETIPADLTVTMAAVKQGLLCLPAFDLVGELRLVDIGLPDDLEPWQAVRRVVVDAAMARAALPARPRDAHKGTFGTAMIVAGSVNYSGAARLAGEAAYRVGAGLVTMAVPTPLHAALAGTFPEATWLLLPHELGVIAEDAAEVVHRNLKRVTAMLVGPGFGLEETTRDFIAQLLGVGAASHGRIGFIQPTEESPAPERPELPPLVFDADGLKLLAQIPDWPRALPGTAVLTPHPGEMSVLTGLEKNAIQADRLGTAERFAQEWEHVVVLKGAFTVIAAPDGRTAVIPVASSALARAGTGDVLAGLIVGLRAQGVPAFEAAVAGAWIHAQAGLYAAEDYGQTASVLAGDVLASVPDVLSDLI